MVCGLVCGVWVCGEIEEEFMPMVFVVVLLCCESFGSFASKLTRCATEEQQLETFSTNCAYFLPICAESHAILNFEFRKFCEFRKFVGLPLKKTPGSFSF